MSFKDKLAEVRDHLASLEEKARQLQNKNLADVLRLALNRIEQAAQHPDIDAAEDPDKANQKPDPYAAQREQREPHAQGQPDPNAQGQTQPSDPNAPFPGTAPPPPATTDEDKKEGVWHPGDAEFDPENTNQDFRDPNNTDLNKDGTLRTAPNTKGVSDIRKDK